MTADPFYLGIPLHLLDRLEEQARDVNRAKMRGSVETAKFKHETTSELDRQISYLRDLDRQADRAEAAGNHAKAKELRGALKRALAVVETLAEDVGKAEKPEPGPVEPSSTPARFQF